MPAVRAESQRGYVSRCDSAGAAMPGVLSESQRGYVGRLCVVAYEHLEPAFGAPKDSRTDHADLVGRLLLCVPLTANADAFDVHCLDGQLVRVPPTRLSLWSMKEPSGETVESLHDIDAAGLVRALHRGCLHADTEDVVASCAMRVCHLFENHASRSLLLMGGAIELLVDALPRLALARAAQYTVLDTLTLVFQQTIGRASVAYHVRRRALLVGLHRHLVEILNGSWSADIEVAALCCAVALLKPASLPRKFALPSHILGQPKGDGAATESLLDAVIKAMRRSPERSATQHWGMSVLAHALAPAASVDGASDILAAYLANRAIMQGAHELVVAAMLRHVASGCTHEVTHPFTEYYRTNIPAKEQLPRTTRLLALLPYRVLHELPLITVATQCLLGLIIGSGCEARAIKLHEAGALRALGLAADLEEHEEYLWTTAGCSTFFERGGPPLPPERANPYSGSLKMLLDELGTAFFDIFANELNLIEALGSSGGGYLEKLTDIMFEARDPLHSWGDMDALTDHLVGCCNACSACCGSSAAGADDDSSDSDDDEVKALLKARVAQIDKEISSGSWMSADASYAY